MNVKIEMEGTPQEVAECLKLIGQTGISVKLPNPTYPVTTSPTTLPLDPMPWVFRPQIMSGDPIGSVGSGWITSKTDKCPNEGHQCFCTGACHTTVGQTSDVRI